MSSTHRVTSQSLGEIFLTYNGTFGTSGAVPAVPTRNDGFLTMSSAGSGVYTLLLERGKKELISEGYIPVRQASYSVDGACYGEVTTDNVSGVTPSIVITFRDADGVAVQPASGDKFKIRIGVKR